MSCLCCLVLCFLLLNFSYSFACNTIDRKYNCDIILNDDNETIIFNGDDGKYNSSNYFMSALKSLKYCNGKFVCKPSFVQNVPIEFFNSKSRMLCLSEDNCLINGNFDVINEPSDTFCTKDSCMDLNKLKKLNVTNEKFQMDTYLCIKVESDDLRLPFCLKPTCKRFEFLEKICTCYDQNNCSCSSVCQNHPSLPTTFALFLSFGDIYVTKGSNISALHWVVVTALSVGLIFLLVMFCKLCEISIDPFNCRNEAQNVEALRRMIASNMDSTVASTSTSTKTSVSAGERVGDQGSPPPSYEQVLKDKCREFKRSVA